VGFTDERFLAREFSYGPDGRGRRLASASSATLRLMDWLDLETLGHTIYTELEPEADVRHDDHIMGRRSGTTRQIDVSIRTRVAGHDVLVVVDGKDRGRRATAQDVDAFASFVDDVGAEKGILLCAAGYSKAALVSARARGLDLCRVHDASSRKWSLDVKLAHVLGARLHAPRLLQSDPARTLRRERELAEPPFRSDKEG